MGAIVTEKQSNMSWTITWKAAGRYPIVADRIYETLADAQAYVNDLTPTASAVPGLVLSVVNDSNERNNGIYYVQSIATSADVPGVLAKAGSGEGSITAGSYGEAVELATIGNIGQIIYVTADSTFNNEEYSEGPYMVTGAGLLVKLGTTTASGDLASDVAALQTVVSELESDKVDKVDGSRLMTDAEGTKLAGVAAGAQVNVIESVKVDGTALTVTDKAVNINLSGKVDKVTGSRLMTDTEGTKLAGIAEGAQVNVIESVKVNGTALTVTDKAVDITVPAAPFQSIIDGDKVLTLADGVLSSTLSFSKETINNVEYLVLKGTDGVEIGKVDTADFVVDGMLESVAVKADNPNILVFTWNADGGSKTTEIDFAKYVDVYKADDTTLELNSTTNTFSVKANVFDSYGAATTALEDAKAYADQAEVDANAYTDDIAGAYAAEGVAASGLRKEIAERDAQVLADANAYTDDIAGAYAAEGVAASGLRKEIAERDAQVLADVANLYQLKGNYEEAGAAAAALEDAKEYADGLVGVYSDEAAGTAASGLRAEIEANKKVTSEALTELDDRVEALEDVKDAYVDADKALETSLKTYADQAEADAINQAKKDAAAALEAYYTKTEVDELLSTNSTGDRAYARQYTDELFNSFQFAANSDIDAIFA